MSPPPFAGFGSKFNAALKTGIVCELYTSPERAPFSKEEAKIFDTNEKNPALPTNGGTANNIKTKTLTRDVRVKNDMNLRLCARLVDGQTVFLHRLSESGAIG